MRVKVFKNLNKGCLSIIALEGPYKNKVVAYAHSAYVNDGVEMKISEASRQRVLKERVKNVHAFVVGSLACIDLIETRYPIDRELAGLPMATDHLHEKKVRYNPYIRGEFFDAETGEAIHHASCAEINARGVFLEAA